MKMHNKHNMIMLITPQKGKIESATQYKTKTKKELLRAIKSFIAANHRLRRLCVEVRLENNYLKRRLQIIEERNKKLRTKQ